MFTFLGSIYYMKRISWQISGVQHIPDHTAHLHWPAIRRHQCTDRRYSLWMERIHFILWLGLAHWWMKIAICAFSLFVFIKIITKLIPALLLLSFSDGIYIILNFWSTILSSTVSATDAFVRTCDASWKVKQPERSGIESMGMKTVLYCWQWLCIKSQRQMEMKLGLGMEWNCWRELGKWKIVLVTWKRFKIDQILFYFLQKANSIYNFISTQMSHTEHTLVEKNMKGNSSMLECRVPIKSIFSIYKGSLA